MNTDKLEKLLNNRLNSEDNLVGKTLLLNKYPELKPKLVKYSMGDPSNMILHREDIESVGIKLNSGKHILQFDIEYFPELYK